jgi:hypothetical protein
MYSMAILWMSSLIQKLELEPQLYLMRYVNMSKLIHEIVVHYNVKVAKLFKS